MVAAAVALSRYAAEDTAESSVKIFPPFILQSQADGSGSETNILELTNVFG